MIPVLVALVLLTAAALIGLYLYAEHLRSWIESAREHAPTDLETGLLTGPTAPLRIAAEINRARRLNGRFQLWLIAAETARVVKTGREIAASLGEGELGFRLDQGRLLVTLTSLPGAPPPTAVADRAELTEGMTLGSASWPEDADDPDELARVAASRMSGR